MKRFLLPFICCSFFHSAQAEIIESNVTLQIKLFYQNEAVVRPPVTTVSSRTATLKTSDFIQEIGTALGQTFSSRARLIYAIEITDGPDRDYFIIRDPSRPTDFTTPLDLFTVEFLNHLAPGRNNRITKGKNNVTTSVGNLKTTGPGEARFYSDGVARYMSLFGLCNKTLRMIPSRQYPPRALPLLSTSLIGYGSYDDREPLSPTVHGYAQGTIKFSPPKVVPGP